MSWRALVGMAQRVSQAEGFTCAVRLRPWPYLGSVSRVCRRLTFSVDSNQPLERRRTILAHEIGHVALGHYQLDDGVWYYTDSPGMNEWEQEADLFEAIALRSCCTPIDHIIPPEQLRLGLRGPEMNPTERRVRAEYRPGGRRVRIAGSGRPKPEVRALLLRLFEEHGI